MPPSSLHLSCSHSMSNDTLSLKLKGLDLLKDIAIRSEGKRRTSLLIDTFEININTPFFLSCNFDESFLTGDRLCLVMLMAFAPSFTALCSDFTQRNYFNIHDFPIFDNVCIETSFNVSDSLKRLLKNAWMLPKLSFISPNSDSLPSHSVRPHNHSSLAWGGGLDSSAALVLFKEFPECSPYYISSGSSQHLNKITSLANDHALHVHVIDTNLKHLYSDHGWTIWTAPFIPAILRGDRLCFPGTTSGSFLSDGYAYKSSRNLWLNALDICGCSISMLHCMSEYLTAKLVYSKNLARLICGPQCSEWGVSYKSLRKAIYMASFDHSFFEDIKLIEDKGLFLKFELPFSERSKFSMDITESVINLIDETWSRSVREITPFISSFRQSWTAKAPLSDSISFVKKDEEVETYLLSQFSNLDIEIMSYDDIDSFKSFNYNSIYHAFLSSQNS